MFLRIVILFFLVILISAARERMKKEKRGDNEGELSFMSIAGKLSRFNNLTKHSRAEKSELVMDKRIHRVANPSASNVTILHVTPSNPNDSDKRAKWQGWQICPLATRVRTFTQWLNHPFLDDQGLTNIRFSCEMPGMTNQYRLIESGTEHDGNNKLKPLACPYIQWSTHNIQRWATGIQVVFGGPSLGALKMNLICDVPNWADTPPGQIGHAKPRPINLGFVKNSLDDLGYDLKSERRELNCPVGAAICGLNTKVRKANGWTDDTGINEVKVMCCPFDDVTLP